jgi:septal ring factor EnvC (AmiA/AmiB activator)
VIAKAFLLALGLAWPVAHAAVQEGLPEAPSATTGPALVPLKHRLQQGSAEVERLEREVRQQESRSRQASEQLQRQEQAIDDLRRQLKALDAAQGATATQPGKS